MHTEDALDVPDLLHILIGEPDRGKQLDILQIIFVKIRVSRIFHVRDTGFHAGEESHAQGDDQQDGEKAPEALADLPQRILPERAVHQYSILSTGSGCSLISTLSMRPLRTLMTLSPIAVSARLCVMTMTLTPRWRHVSCSSLRICFPV